MFDITFQDEQGKRQHVWQTSWGLSTRMIGALIMTHGDDQGLKLPPRVAPIQAVVVPIWRKDTERAPVREFVDRLVADLKGVVRVWVDDREQYTPGWKYNEHELRGVPVRLEVGPRDVTQGAVMSVRRDNRAKESIPLTAVRERLPALLDEVQRALFQAALDHRAQNTVVVRDAAALEAHFAEQRGFVALPWDGDAAAEARIKEKTGATLRCIPIDQTRLGNPAPDGRKLALFARAY